MAPRRRRISASAARPVCSTPRSASRVLVELVRELVPDGPDLEHHHADRVGDDVVQLARDPRALLGNRHAGRRFALALGLGRARLGRVRLLDPRVQRETREPGDAEHERDEEHLARLVVREVVDDRRRAAEYDDEADARQHRVVQVPEQERRRHPGEVDAGHERDQLPVDERDRRPQQPERRGRAEGIAAAREEREHGDDDRRDAEPQRRVRGVLGVAPEHELEHAGERQEHDHDVEPEPSRDALRTASRAERTGRPQAPPPTRVGARIVVRDQCGSSLATTSSGRASPSVGAMEIRSETAGDPVGVPTGLAPASEPEGGVMSPMSTNARELAARSNDGVQVLLLWHPDDNAVTVSVEDARIGDRFQIAVAPDRALDAFHHPYAYAA